MLTYPAAYEYTVTKDVTFQARWAFDELDKIETYLTNAGDPALIAVAGGVQPNNQLTSLTWKNLLLVIKNANKEVELDLSGSTLALFGTGFDYKDDQQNAKGYDTGEKYIKKLILPSDATSITSVFMDGPFSKLKAVSGLNVSAIPEGAFNEVSTLAAVAFPAAETIGTAAFNNCTSLTSVSLPVATDISLSAFFWCKKLTSVSLPAAETIEAQAFLGCEKLTSVSLPAATDISFSAFYNCTSLTSVSLPAAETIGYSAFHNCTSLTTVTIAAGCEINDTYMTHDFKTFYETTNGKAAGVYTYSNPNWNYAPLEENS
jgi:hypothetical protein